MERPQSVRSLHLYLLGNSFWSTTRSDVQCTILSAAVDLCKQGSGGQHMDSEDITCTVSIIPWWGVVSVKLQNAAVEMKIVHDFIMPMLMSHFKHVDKMFCLSLMLQKGLRDKPLSSEEIINNPKNLWYSFKRLPTTNCIIRERCILIRPHKLHGGKPQALDDVLYNSFIPQENREPGQFYASLAWFTGFLCSRGGSCIIGDPGSVN